MAPGVISSGGFLGSDTRPVEEIVATDTAVVTGADLTHAQIAAELEEIRRKAMASPGAVVDVDGGLHATYGEAMGRIPCPWADGMFAKGEIELTDEAGRTVRFTPLSVHLIETHGFYQGRGSRYRLEPQELIDMLFEEGD